MKCRSLTITLVCLYLLFAGLGYSNLYSGPVLDSAKLVDIMRRNTWTPNAQLPQKMSYYKSGSYYIIPFSGQVTQSLSELINPRPEQSKLSELCPLRVKIFIDDAVYSLSCKASIDLLKTDYILRNKLNGPCIDYANYSIQVQRWECNSYRSAFAVALLDEADSTYHAVGVFTSSSEAKDIDSVIKSILRVYTEDNLINIRSNNLYQETNSNIYHYPDVTYIIDTVKGSAMDYLKFLILKQQLENNKLNSIDEYTSLERNSELDSTGLFELTEDQLNAINESAYPPVVMSPLASMCDSIRKAGIDSVVEYFAAHPFSTMDSGEDEYRRNLTKGNCIGYIKYMWSCVQRRSDLYHHSVIVTDRALHNRASTDSQPSILLMVLSQRDDKYGWISTMPKDSYFSADELKIMPAPKGSPSTSMYEHLLKLMGKR